MGTKAVCLTASQDQIRTEGPGVSVSAQEVELTVCWPQRGAGGWGGPPGESCGGPYREWGPELVPLGEKEESP